MSAPQRGRVVGLLLLAGVAGSREVRGDGVDPETAQRAFAAGDLERRRGDPIETADPVARAIARVRDRAWRPVPGAIAGGGESPSPEGADPYAKRANGLVAALRPGRAGAEEAPYEDDPLPVLSALVRDRARRERAGARPDAPGAPLRAVLDRPEIAAFLESWVPEAYGGPAAYVGGDRREEREARDEIRALARRNGWIAAGALGGLLAVSLVGGLFVRPAARRRDASLGSVPPPAGPARPDDS